MVPIPTVSDRVVARLPEPRASKPRRHSKRAKPALIVLLLALVAGAGGWIGVRHTTWLGPWLADSLRLVVGVEAVARIEDFSAWVEDRWRSLGPERAPRSMDQVRPSTLPSSSAPRHVESPAPEATVLPQFRPADVGPMFAKVTAPGDGIWLPVSEAALPGEPPILWTTLLHPDVRRPWAECSWWLSTPSEQSSISLPVLLIRKP